MYPSVATRMKDSGTQPLLGSYWFVADGVLNTATISTDPAINPDNLDLHDIFGAGVFQYAPSSESYYYRVSDKMQLSAADRTSVGSSGSSANGVKDQSMLPGCDTTDGNMRSACNLVCFNVKRGLLTPVSGLSNLVIHHVSVAEFATVEETNTANTHLSARRRLLETVTVAGSGAVVGNGSTPAGMAMFKIHADPRDATPVATDASDSSASNSSTTVTVKVDDDDDDANVGMIVGIVVGASALIGAVVVALTCCNRDTNRKPRGYSSLEQQDAERNKAYMHHDNNQQLLRKRVH
jgi:hypothetical protein